MIERQAVGHSTPSVMACDAEPFKAKPPHHSNHVAGHSALRIRLMIFSRLWTAAAPVTTQIGTDHAELLCQDGRDLTPHQVRLGKAVQQQ